MIAVVLESKMQDLGGIPEGRRTPMKIWGPFDSAYDAAVWAWEQDWGGKEWLAMPLAPIHGDTQAEAV